MQLIRATLRRWVLKEHVDEDVGNLQEATKVHQRLQSRIYWKGTEACMTKLRLVRPFEEDAEGLPPRALEQEHQLGSFTPASKPWYILHPSGWVRQIWDTLAVVLIYALVLVIPVEIAFYEQDNSCDYFSDAVKGDMNRLGRPWPRSAAGFSTFTNVFFLLDIFLNFFTGFYTVGSDQEPVAVYCLKSIAVNYLDLRCYPNLLLDVAACLPLNCILVAAGHSTYNVGQLVRLLRVVTIGRRAHGSPFRWLDTISDLRHEFSYNIRRLISFGFFLFVLMHYLACLLWITLRVQDFPPLTWPSQLDIVYHPVIEQWLWCYFAVSSAMIGLGYASYPPQTWPEALCYVLIMIASNVTYAFFNGLILATILSSASGRQEFKDFMDRSLAMLKLRKVPQPLKAHIIEYLKHKYRRHCIVRDADVLAELPPPIQRQLAVVSVGQTLGRMPLFATNLGLLQDVAPLVVHTVAIEGQILQQQGHGVEQVYFIQQGFVDVEMDGCLVDTLGKGQHLCEVALLRIPVSEEEKLIAGSVAGRRFTSPVTYKALCSCELYAIRAADFDRVRQLHPEVEAELAAAAARHCHRLEKYRNITLQPSMQADSSRHAHDPNAATASEPFGFVHRSITMPEAREPEGTQLERSLARCSVGGLGTVLDTAGVAGLAQAPGGSKGQAPQGRRNTKPASRVDIYAVSGFAPAKGSGTEELS